MGILALMYVLPHVETLGGFWAVFATGTAVAAWVNFGSPRVSYGGYQIGLAFYKVILQGWGPVTELTVARDRLVGIAFGLVVFGILEHVLWPVRASDRRQQRFADVLRSLAALARLGARDRAGAGRDRELDDMRRRIAQDLGETQRLLEESKFELQAGELGAFQRSRGRRPDHLSRAAVARLSAPRARGAAGGSARGRASARGRRGQEPRRACGFDSRPRHAPVGRPRCRTGSGRSRARLHAAWGVHGRGGGRRASGACSSTRRSSGSSRSSIHGWRIVPESKRRRGVDRGSTEAEDRL